MAATVIALTGTAYAADLIGPRDIAKNAVRAKHIQDGQVRTAEVADNSLTGTDVNEGTLTLPAGPPGPIGETGPRGQDGSPDTPQQVRDKLLAVDGPGSSIDADVVDGKSSADFAPASAESWTSAGLPEPPFFNTCATANSWENFAPQANNTVAYYRDPFGTVHLRGVARKCGAPSATVFTLQAGYKPAIQEVEVAQYSASVGADRVDINSNGTVVVNNSGTLADGEWVSFDGLTFRCAPRGSNGCP